MKTRLVLVIVIFLGLTLALAQFLEDWTGIAKAGAGAGELHVCPNGCDYSSVQAAVDAANSADVIKIAQGTYTDIHARDGITQVVYISKTVTVQGGYTTTNWITPDPVAHPTTLDAQGRGRVLYVAGDPSLRLGSVQAAGSGQAISPTIEGLRITGGDSTGLGGSQWGDKYDAGGGVYITGATVVISGCQICDNSALYYGGGLAALRATVIISDNQVSSNAAMVGGGIILLNSDTVLSGNTITSNAATASSGGGVYVDHGTAVLIHNTITFNTAKLDGGGVYAIGALPLNLAENYVSHNEGGEHGGGVTALYGKFQGAKNFIADNSAYEGGGLWLFALVEGPSLDSSTIISNTASRFGGGLYLCGSDVALTNNVVAGNRAGDEGSGLYIVASSPHLLHTTIAYNSGGAGIHITDNWYGHGAVALTNTILVSHTVGVYVESGNAATLESTLWHGNTSDWNGAGAINHNNDYAGDPAFVNPNAGDYHIGPGSAAIDAGVDAGVTSDIDDQTRDANPDLGADEYYYKEMCFARLNDGIIYSTVQAAVDASMHLTDVIKVAGYCSGVSARADVTQVVYISKTVTVQGGYTATNWTTPDPVAHPTTLDAQGQGRVLYITGQAISVTIEGLRITDGDAEGLGGGYWIGADVGGGVYIFTATVNISGCHITHNSAPQYGGGIVTFQADVTVGNSVISSNISQTGGGIILLYSEATLSGNTITSNTATTHDGGGVYAHRERITLTNNVITSNTAELDGGGVYVSSLSLNLSKNYIAHNEGGRGGGVTVIFGRIEGDGNLIADNSADEGGGLWLFGLYEDYHPSLDSSTIISNTASKFGGGLYLCGSDIALTNNIVAGNRAGDEGSGLYIAGSSPYLLHNTIARNSGGDGSGLYVTSYYGNPGTVALTNTILVSHTVGVYVESGNTATLESTLWHGNTSDWDGAGAINHDNDYAGDPAFVDPNVGDYHIGPGSAAIDAGVDAGVTADIDGESRPGGVGYDLGADEWVELCNALTDVSISGLASGYTDTLYIFTSVITPADATEPITYTWSPEPDGGQGTDSASYEWATPGVYTITLKAENCGGTVSDTHVIIIEIPSPPCTGLTGVSIGGPASGYTDILYTFTAVVSPANATPPISYAWSPEPDSGQGTACAAYVWTDPGVKVIIVIAENCGGLAAIANQHTIHIGVEESVVTIFLPVVFRNR